jgi:NodT family efflux transporter outer membrane factor (OMF) lipoprotein
MLLIPGAKALAISLAAAATLAGCVLGPNFHSPEAPAAERYTPEALPTETAATPGVAGVAQRFVTDQDIPAEWWSLYRSEALDQMIRQAIADSPTLAAAQATLRQAQENLKAQSGALLWPSVDAQASATRQRSSAAALGIPGGGSVFNLYHASVNVSYLLDVFGGSRRQLEALRAQVDFEAFQLQAAHLALTANIITTAVREASLRAQIQATQDILIALQKQLDVVERRFELGAVSRSDILAQRTSLAQIRATLPPLEKQLAQTRHQLSVYLGKLPNEAAFPEFRLDALQLPRELPVSLPSSLVRQRPDIRASEALLHQASAQIGVATANLYPQITLSGNYGSETTQFNKLADSSSMIWSAGASLLQPIFHGGELSAKRRAAVAAYDQAAAQYREIVLGAFQNVADVLRALETDARTLQAQADAENLARDSLELTQRQFQLGAVSYLSLLNAQQQYSETRINLVQAQAARYSDTAALFQALGGGWWNRGASAEEGGKPSR